MSLTAPPAPDQPTRLPLLREAVTRHLRLHLTADEEDGSRLEATVRPLGLLEWGGVTTLATWWEDRGVFHPFRVDRLLAVEPLDGPFEDEPGKTLDDMLRQAEARMDEANHAIDN